MICEFTTQRPQMEGIFVQTAAEERSVACLGFDLNLAANCQRYQRVCSTGLISPSDWPDPY